MNATLKEILDDRVAQAIIAINIITSIILLAGSKGALTNVVSNLEGVLVLAVGSFFFYRNWKLYGNMTEGKVWMLFFGGMLLSMVGMIGTTIAERAGIAALSNSIVVLRSLAYVLFTSGFALKIKFSGYRPSFNDTLIAAMFAAMYGLLVFTLAVGPGIIWGEFDIIIDSYAMLAVIEIFILFVVVMILQMDVSARGWIPIAIGMFFISVGDALYNFFMDYASTHGGTYDGHPYRLIWYYGLWLVSFGAYYLRKKHLEMIM